ncbi:ribonuclease YeeF family protein [Oceanobacillus sp. J11TS1]|uniref:ribonuclease YeeF family protein n=1 Tax=Oceanobacillus sp. J11TS1 TaxID=2807191 RepID=UPI001B05A39B|nr:LXG domain-containing protein [Oceanobacillus sp. J11TS1]GIO24687.1 hypothetical protein J11TS1_32680 [Oceanobacillus sp. J11TS1]
MKTLEASTIHEGIEQTTKLLGELANQVVEVQGKITGILQTESDFSGRTASSIRAFYRDIHSPLAVYLEGIVREYHQTLLQIQQSLYEFDSSEQAYIDEEFLQSEMKSQLQKTKEHTVQLTDETNELLRSVQDIIHLSNVSDEEILYNVGKTEDKVNKTIENLYQFDQEATNKLTTTEKDFDLLENYLKDIQSLTGDHQLLVTNYKANSIKQLDVHQEMIAGLFQKAIPKEYVIDILTAITSSSYLAMGSTAASIVRNEFNDKMSMTTDYRIRALGYFLDNTSPVMLEDQYNSLNVTTVSTTPVRDYKGEFYGNYLTLQDGRIVRSFMDHEGVMKYHFVEAIPEERLKPPEVEEEDFFTKLGNSFKKTVDNTVELGKDKVTGFGNRLEELNDNKMNSFYDFSNYLTVGALDTGKDTYRAMVGYGENMLNSSEDFVNWLTMGGVDLAKGTFAPEDPNSKEHIANVLSMGMLMLFVNQIQVQTFHHQAVNHRDHKLCQRLITIQILPLPQQVVLYLMAGDYQHLPIYVNGFDNRCQRLDLCRTLLGLII